MTADRRKAADTVWKNARAAGSGLISASERAAGLSTLPQAPSLTL